MLRGAYRILSDLAGPVLTLWLIARARRGKEDACRLPERFGIASVPRPEGRLVWLHAASVGESLSILPLITALKERGWQIVVTTGTVTSARVMLDRLPSGAIHQFVPLDRRAWVQRFTDHWRPNLVLWTESELWPNMLALISDRGIPSALINARMSDRTLHGWQRWPTFAAQIVGSFTTILAQSSEDARRFSVLGGKNVHIVGNLKYAASALPIDEIKLSALRAQIGPHPVWLAASIHPGEDLAALTAHRHIAEHHPDLLTIIVPRHPERAEDMAATIQKAGLTVARRSAGESIQARTSFYIADTMGELGLFYALCDIVFIGKTLAVGGGQNPMEPAQSGCALLFGPDMSNFREVASELLASGGAIEVTDASALGAVVNRLLGNASERNAMIKTSGHVVTRHNGALAETLTHLNPFLDQSSP